MSCNEQLENVKLSLYNVEQISDIKANPVVKATIIKVITSIPLLGDLVDGTIDTILTNFQEKKRQELIDIILSNSQNITSDMVNNVEFIMNFGRTLDSVNRLATNDKIKYFANLLKNGYFTDDKIKNDEFEEAIHLLTQLSHREILILCLYHKHMKHLCNWTGQVVELKEFRSFIHETTKIFDCDENTIIEYLHRLHGDKYCVFLDCYTFKEVVDYKFTTEIFDSIYKRIVGELDE